MAEVHIVDIDGERWDIKDLPLTARVATLEDIVSVKDLPGLKITMKNGYEASVYGVLNHYIFGKIHFLYFQFRDLKGSKIGSYDQIVIASVDLHPIKSTHFFLVDSVSRALMNCYLRPDGSINIGSSYGVRSGNNDCQGQLILAEK